eukprot:Rmarinus@m.934
MAVPNVSNQIDPEVTSPLGKSETVRNPDASKLAREELQSKLAEVEKAATRSSRDAINKIRRKQQTSEPTTSLPNLTAQKESSSRRGSLVGVACASSRRSSGAGSRRGSLSRPRKSSLVGMKPTLVVQGITAGTATVVARTAGTAGSNVAEMSTADLDVVNDEEQAQKGNSDRQDAAADDGQTPLVPAAVDVTAPSESKASYLKSPKRPSLLVSQPSGGAAESKEARSSPRHRSGPEPPHGNGLRNREDVKGALISVEDDADGLVAWQNEGGESDDEESNQRPHTAPHGPESQDLKCEVPQSPCRPDTAGLVATQDGCGVDPSMASSSQSPHSHPHGHAHHSPAEPKARERPATKFANLPLLERLGRPTASSARRVHLHLGVSPSSPAMHTHPATSQLLQDTDDDFLTRVVDHLVDLEYARGIVDDGGPLSSEPTPGRPPPCPAPRGGHLARAQATSPGPDNGGHSEPSQYHRGDRSRGAASMREKSPRREEQGAVGGGASGRTNDVRGSHPLDAGPGDVTSRSSPRSPSGTARLMHPAPPASSALGPVAPHEDSLADPRAYQTGYVDDNQPRKNPEFWNLSRYPHTQPVLKRPAVLPTATVVGTAGGLPGAAGTTSGSGNASVSECRAQVAGMGPNKRLNVTAQRYHRRNRKGSTGFLMDRLSRCVVDEARLLVRDASGQVDHPRSHYQNPRHSPHPSIPSAGHFHPDGSSWKWTSGRDRGRPHVEIVGRTPRMGCKCGKCQLAVRAVAAAAAAHAEPAQYSYKLFPGYDLVAAPPPPPPPPAPSYAALVAAAAQYHRAQTAPQPRIPRGHHVLPPPPGVGRMIPSLPLTSSPRAGPAIWGGEHFSSPQPVPHPPLSHSDPYARHPAPLVPQQAPHTHVEARGIMSGPITPQTSWHELPTPYEPPQIAYAPPSSAPGSFRRRTASSSHAHHRRSLRQLQIDVPEPTHSHNDPSSNDPGSTSHREAAVDRHAYDVAGVDRRGSGGEGSPHSPRGVFSQPSPPLSPSHLVSTSPRPLGSSPRILLQHAPRGGLDMPALSLRGSQDKSSSTANARESVGDSTGSGDALTKAQAPNDVPFSTAALMDGTGPRTETSPNDFDFDRYMRCHTSYAQGRALRASGPKGGPCRPVLDGDMDLKQFCAPAIAEALRTRV